MPILNVLENNNLNHILCCIVRYFGGIKLGAGGLVRAYSNSCSEIILKSSIVNLVPGKLCSISFNYDNTKIIDNFLKDYVISKNYDFLISYEFKIADEFLDNFSNELSKYGEFKVISDCYIEKRVD